MWNVLQGENFLQFVELNVDIVESSCDIFEKTAENSLKKIYYDRS